MIYTLANLLTFLRILLTPLFIYFLFGRHTYFEIFALIIFIIASVTDAYDGYFARKQATVSDLGKFLDPLADKILMSAAFISFVFLKFVPLWMVVLIIARDFWVTGLRIAFTRRSNVMETRRSAKIKTGVQIVAVCVILVYTILLRWEIFLGIGEYLDVAQNYHIIYYFMFLVTLFTVWTGIEYIIVNWKSILELFAREK